MTHLHHFYRRASALIWRALRWSIFTTGSVVVIMVTIYAVLDHAAIGLALASLPSAVLAALFSSVLSVLTLIAAVPFCISLLYPLGLKISVWLFDSQAQEQEITR